MCKENGELVAKASTTGVVLSGVQEICYEEAMKAFGGGDTPAAVVRDILTRPHNLAVSGGEPWYRKAASDLGISLDDGPRPDTP